MLGDCDGDPLGEIDGEELDDGRVDGDSDGSALMVGSRDGILLVDGESEGAALVVGSKEGLHEGDSDGCFVGILDGDELVVGWDEGFIVGDREGAGDPVGDTLNDG